LRVATANVACGQVSGLSLVAPVGSVSALSRHRLMHGAMGGKQNRFQSV
jgi:hypothetical protein